jgi:hypothetical protein
MVDVAVRLHTPVYLQHRNAGGLPAFVSIQFLDIGNSTTFSCYSSKEQHYSSRFSVYPYNVEANYSTIYLSTGIQT